MNGTFKSILASAIVVSANLAYAAPIPIDLSTWESDGPGNWQVQGSENDSVFQFLNSDPSVFYKDGANAQNTSISGAITVETGGDDDYVGFVLGYQKDELLSATSEYILIDWKQGDQSFGGRDALEGMSISLVQGSIDPNDFWDHSVGITEIARATSLGSTGWTDFQSYNFDIIFTSNLIEVKVDDVIELSITAADAGLASFSDGSAGFYNYSQGNVRYAGLAEEVINVPDPTPTPTPVSAPGVFSIVVLGLISLLRLRKRR